MTEQQQPSNLPAVVVDRGIVAAAADTDSWRDAWRETAELAAYIADTEFVPKALRGNRAAAAAAMLYGREVGLPPMTALNGVHVVEGSPALAAETMRSLVLAAGHDLEFTETTGTICRVRGRRRGSETWTTVEWTIDMARAAGLTSKNNWKNYPRRMLQARASSELCELTFPDVIHGFRAVEAQQDQPAEDDTATTAHAPRSTTRVRRTRAASPAAEQLGGTPAPAAAAAPPKRPAAGPSIPLPGEDGYDSPAGSGSETDAPRVAAPGDATSAGAGERAPDPGPAPETSGEGERSARPVTPSPDPDEPVDAQVVDEPVDDTPDEPSDVVDADVVETVGDVKPPAPAPIGGIRPAQLRMIQAKFGTLGLKGDEHRDERLRLTGILIGRPIESTRDLTKDDAGTLIDTLALCNSLEQLARVAADTEAAERGTD